MDKLQGLIYGAEQIINKPGMEECTDHVGTMVKVGWVRDVYEFLKSIPQWIPVTERMPDEYEAVEIWLKYDEYSCTAYWCKGKGGSHWTEVGTDGEKEFAFYYVSHWRKPQPPQGR